MEQQLSAEDRISLYELYSRSTRLITNRDVEGWLALFTEDAEFFLPGIDDIGVPDMRMRGHAELRRFITDTIEGRFDPAMGLERGTKKRYLVGNIMLDGAGDGQARGSAYFFLIIPGRGGEAPRLLGTGVYDDHFVKTATGWKIKQRTLSPDS